MLEMTMQLKLAGIAAVFTIVWMAALVVSEEIEYRKNKKDDR